MNIYVYEILQLWMPLIDIFAPLSEMQCTNRNQVLKYLMLLVLLYGSKNRHVNPILNIFTVE